MIALGFFILFTLTLLIASFVFPARRKVDPISESSKPVIVTIGIETTNTKEERRLHQLNHFLENDENWLEKSIRNCKTTAKIYKKIDRIAFQYSEIFTEDLMSSLHQLAQKESTEKTDLRVIAIRQIEEQLEKVKESIPAEYLKSIDQYNNDLL